MRGLLVSLLGLALSGGAAEAPQVVARIPVAAGSVGFEPPKTVSTSGRRRLISRAIAMLASVCCPIELNPTIRGALRSTRSAMSETKAGTSAAQATTSERERSRHFMLMWAGPSWWYSVSRTRRCSATRSGKAAAQKTASPRSFQGSEPAFQAWVFTIARHQVLDWRRRAARKPTQDLPVTGLADPLAPDDPAADAVEGASTRAALALIATFPWI